MTKETLVNALTIILDLPKGNTDLDKLPAKTLQMMFDGLNKNLQYLSDLENRLTKVTHELLLYKAGDKVE